MSMFTADPFALAADILDPPEHPYAGNPVDWVTDELGEFLWSEQRAIAEDLVAHRYVAVQSAHQTGKSFLAARIVLHWITSHPVGDAFVVTTAPTWNQVRAVLWREIGRGHRKIPEERRLGRLNEAAEWKIGLGIGPDELVAIGRKPADYDPSAFQGLHAEKMLVIIDEAGGVPKAIYDAIDSMVTNVGARVLAIGNPDDPSAHFATICKPGSGWRVRRIDALTSPNFTKAEVRRFPKVREYMIREGVAPSVEDVPDRLRPNLVSVEWVDERIRRWGVDSPLFKSKVRGVFPTVTLDTVTQPGWVLAAQIREMPVDATDPRLGVDVARYGDDRSVIAIRMGGHIRIVADIAKGPTTEVAGLVIRHGQGRDLTPIANVDDTGIGGGVTDFLVEDRYPVLPLISGSSGLEKMRNGRPQFVDARSEWWWTLREALQGPTQDGSDGWIDLDPDDDELAAQLLNVKYTVNRHGQIRVETKDEMKKRGLPSPDRADAVVYTMVREARIPEAQLQYMITADLFRPNSW